jgi:hypothetical protein
MRRAFKKRLNKLFWPRLTVGWPGLALLLFVASPRLFAADDYVLGPDSRPREGAPKGEVTKYTFEGSKIFPGTKRNYWIYVPQEYNAAQPACLLVVQDGVIYNTPTVLDNLIARHEMPVTIAVFVAPGIVASSSTNIIDRLNRSYEYDGLGDRYVRFLTEELLPVVQQKYHFSASGNDHAIAGTSSGAICAFNAAWERPDYFTRVFSAIGSYGSLRGGDTLAGLIRKTEPKPIRVFIQDGSGDARGEFGDWPKLNAGMAAALQFAGYEVTNVWGDGAHTMKHADSLFPDVMRYLWKDYPTPVAAGRGSSQPLVNLLPAGESWERVAVNQTNASSLAVDAAGLVYFYSSNDACIYRVGLEDKIDRVAKCKSNLTGLAFGPDHRLYASDPQKNRILAFDSEGHQSVVAHGLACNSLSISHGGLIYAAGSPDHKLWLTDGRREKRTIDCALKGPCDVAFTPDQGSLLVAEPGEHFVYLFEVEPDGTLRNGENWVHLQLDDISATTVCGQMAVDTLGRIYIPTLLGIQLSDPLGRIRGIITQPAGDKLRGVVFGGAAFDMLYANCDHGIFRRRLKAHGVLSAAAPIKPPIPQL